LHNILLFTVAGYRYGIRVDQVKEIIRITAFKPLPDQPPFVEGVINLRGVVIPLVDFRRRFIMGITEKTIDKRIIICRINEFLVGFLVDSVEEVFTFREDQLRNVTQQDLGLDFRFIDKIAIRADELISILLTNRIFSKEEVDRLVDFYNKSSVAPVPVPEKVAIVENKDEIKVKKKPVRKAAAKKSPPKTKASRGKKKSDD